MVERVLERHLRAIWEELKGFSDAHLVAVSKGQPLEKIIEAYQLGQRDFGENYVQELIDKAREIQKRGITDLRWHFIGHLQRNKVKALLPFVFAIHTIDSVRLAQEISKRWLDLRPEEDLRVFLEINIDREPTKSGFLAEDLESVIPELSRLAGLNYCGLMCVPSVEGGLSGSAFRKLRELELKCHPLTHGELSMGMSQDYRAALREGVGAAALWVRIGSGIFGPRSLSTG